MSRAALLAAITLTMACGSSGPHRDGGSLFDLAARPALVVQSGHVTPVERLFVERQGPPLYLTTVAGPDARLWRRNGPTRDDWQLLRRFHPLVERTALLDGALVLFRTTKHSLVFEPAVGFGEPALGPRHGLPGGANATIGAARVGQRRFVWGTGVILGRRVTRLYHAPPTGGLTRVELPVPEHQLAEVAMAPALRLVILTNRDHEAWVMGVAERGALVPLPAAYPEPLALGAWVGQDTTIDLAPPSPGEPQQLLRLTARGSRGPPGPRGGTVAPRSAEAASPAVGIERFDRRR